MFADLLWISSESAFNRKNTSIIVSLWYDTHERYDAKDFLCVIDGSFFFGNENCGNPGSSWAQV